MEEETSPDNLIKVSCLVPAFNEGPRIAGVLKALANHPLISEIIVIDNHSTDDTAQVAAQFPVKVIEQLDKGKTKAIIAGIKEAKEDLIMLIDSDLVGLTPEAITELIEPVLQGKADISISLRINSPKFWRDIGLDYISGERVLPKKLLADHIEELSRLSNFGLETFMNKLILQAKYRIKIVPWSHVESPYKYKKDGMWTGIKGDAKMMRDIFRVASPWEILIMIIKMRHRRV